MFLKLRAEQLADVEPIFQVNQAAFGRPDEAQLVDALRQGGYARVSMVAVADGFVIGHILLSDLPIVTVEGTVPALALAPLAITPAWQNQGIGSQLIRTGLDACRKQQHRIVIVLGHPAYYLRFGFSVELARPLESPFAGDSFMALELASGALAGVRGKVEYPPPFCVF